MVFGMKNNNKKSAYISSVPLNPLEAVFLNWIFESVPGRVVFPKIKLTDFVKQNQAAGGIVGPAKARLNSFLFLEECCVDFLICDSSFNPICAIDLVGNKDGRSKTHERRKARALMEAGIRHAIIDPRGNPEEKKGLIRNFSK